MSSLSVRIPEDLELRLVSLSKKTKVSQSKIIRDLLDNYMEDLEDYYDGIEALKKFKKSGRKAIPADEVFEKLGLK